MWLPVWIQPYARTHPATTAGSAATSSTPCTWPTVCCAPGPSGTATSRKPRSRPTSRSLETCGAMKCRRWRWPTSPIPPGSPVLASTGRGRAEEVGRPSRRWANSCTGRAGVACSCPARHVRTARSWSSSSPRQRSRPSSSPLIARGSRIPRPTHRDADLNPIPRTARRFPQARSRHLLSDTGGPSGERIDEWTSLVISRAVAPTAGRSAASQPRLTSGAPERLLRGAEAAHVRPDLWRHQGLTGPGWGRVPAGSVPGSRGRAGTQDRIDAAYRRAGDWPTCAPGPATSSPSAGTTTPSSGRTRCGTRTSRSCGARASPSSVSASSPGRGWSPRTARSSSTGSTTSSGGSSGAASPSTSRRAPRPLPPGSAWRTPTRCRWTGKGIAGGWDRARRGVRARRSSRVTPPG